MTCRSDSGSSRSPSAVEPVTSQKTTVTRFRTSWAAGAAASGAPQLPQNRNPAGLSRPQTAQICTSGESTARRRRRPRRARAAGAAARARLGARMALRGYSLPLSPEGRASLVPAPPWHYVGDFLVIEYWADPEAVRAVLPPGLEPNPDDPGRAAALFVDWQSCS